MIKRELPMKKIIISLLAVISTGCSIGAGSYGINSHFSYPNSNVVPMKQVKATISKLSFIIPPSFDGDEIIKLTQDAVAQQPGADLLLNYSLDTKMTNFIIFTTMDMTITGTAAKMDVGSQELQRFYKKVQYKTQ